MLWWGWKPTENLFKKNSIKGSYLYKMDKQNVSF